MTSFSRISRIASAALLATGFALPALAQGSTAAAPKPAQTPATHAPIHRAAAPAAGTATTATGPTTSAKPTEAKPADAKTPDVKPAVKPAGNAAATPAPATTTAPRATN